LIFSITGLLKWFTHVIPTPVVKGIQVGAGISLVISAGTSLLQPLGWITPNAGDNLIWALFAFLALLSTQRATRVPYALMIFILGLVLSVYIAGWSNLPAFRTWQPHTFIPTWLDLQKGALEAGLGQIPLTTLNSIIAVSVLSSDLLPHLPAPEVTSLGVSVALMNLIAGWFGAMPVCHGSGGLAAQYRFGARSGASVIFLGLFKVLFGLFFGEELVRLLREYPKSLLGVMVIAAGLELTKVGENLNNGAKDLWEVNAAPISPGSRDNAKRKTHKQLSDEERRDRWTVMCMTIGGLLAFKNDGVGFVAGMLCHWACLLSKDTWQGWSIFRNAADSRRFTWSRRRVTSLEEEEQLLSEH
jgi:MFS superfamily sulfate permease-like transporter